MSCLRASSGCAATVFWPTVMARADWIYVAVCCGSHLPRRTRLRPRWRSRVQRPKLLRRYALFAAGDGYAGAGRWLDRPYANYWHPGLSIAPDMKCLAPSRPALASVCSGSTSPARGASPRSLPSGTTRMVPTSLQTPTRHACLMRIGGLRARWAWRDPSSGHHRP